MENRLVVIPTYNEIENIEAITERVLNLNDGFFHLLIVDDNSPDGTAQVIKQKQEKYPNRLFLLERKGKQGLGTAYIHAFRWAVARNYEYIFEMDADFSHNPEDILRLYQMCENEADMAIGSRYVTGVNVVNWSMKRVLMSFFASKYVKFITGMPIHDATSGFVCYRKKVLDYLLQANIQFVGYAFQIEMKFKAWDKGFLVKEIPIIFTDRTKGVSKMSSKIFKEAFLGVISMKINALFKGK